MKKKGESFFWTSYADLMTSLFFIMLVLFVLVIVLLHNRMEKIEKERGEFQTQLKNITELQTSIKKIDSNYFEYDTKFNRFTLKNVSVKFIQGSCNMDDIDASDLARLSNAGRAIRNFMKTAKDSLGEKAQYIVIIEGQASKDGYIKNDELSYNRAMALYDFWTNKEKINFDDLPCEVIVSGSGTRSKFREQEYINGKKNEANQRFVIHIIPKLSEMNNALK